MPYYDIHIQDDILSHNIDITFIYCPAVNCAMRRKVLLFFSVLLSMFTLGLPPPLWFSDDEACESDHLWEHIQWQCRNTWAAWSITEASGRRLVTAPGRPGVFQMGEVRMCPYYCKAALGKQIQDCDIFLSSHYKRIILRYLRHSNLIYTSSGRMLCI